MRSDNDFTVHVEGENLNLKIAPGSEEEWKRAVSLVELAAELDGVELGSSEMQSFEEIAERFENEVGDLRREFDSVQTQLETVMDNFVSDEELESRLNSIEEMIQEGGSASVDVDEKISAMWDMIASEMAELDESVEEVHQDRESDGSSGSESDSPELPDGVRGLESEEVEDVLERDLKSETMRILSDDEDDQDQGDSGESGTGSSSGEGVVSLSEFREMSVEEREEDVLQVIRDHGPVHTNEIGEELFGKEIETGSQEYKEIHNRISNLGDEIEKEQSGRKTLYKVEESQESEPEDTGDDDSDSVEEGEETSDEDSESEEAVDRPDLDDVEWVGIEEAVADYRDDKELTYLINRESRKSFKSITTPQALAKTSENRNDWAAVRKLPEEFQG